MELPQEFVQRMHRLLGQEAQAFFAGYTEAPRRQGLRINRLKLADPQPLLEAGFTLSAVPWAPDGWFYPDSQRPGKHLYHDAGLYYIQEPSAMAPAVLLDARPGERVLDLCAAPGGKSTQIASDMQGEGLLICNEIHPGRAKILSQNIERMGIRNAVVLSESPERLAERFFGFFDRILVDAPCSGEGMFRKEPAALEQWSPALVQQCARRQAAILDAAAGMLCPGGRLVYSTCTFSPEENEGAVSEFLERHPEFELQAVPGHEKFSPGRGDWVSNPARGIESTMRLWPHKLEGEGHFAAVLRKREDVGGIQAVAVQETVQASGAQWKDYLSFMDAALAEPVRDRLLLFGESVYRLPQDTPSLQKLKVVRPGWQLGSFRKNRFEPAHALAMGLDGPQAAQSVCFDVDAPELRDYLRGMTISSQQPGGGWRLVVADTFVLGWAKLSQGILKNHYPKGLRRMGENAF